MEKDNKNIVQNKRIEELSIYYLYFLCVFLNKLVEKNKNIEIDYHKDIEFYKFIEDEFIKKCDTIEIKSIEMVNEQETYKEININFCERFIYIVNEMFISKKINLTKIRENIYSDLKYISNYYFGIFLTERSINLEPALEYLDSKINDIIIGNITKSIFIVDSIEKNDTNDIIDSYIDFTASKKELEENDGLYECYIKAKGELNKKIIDYNNRIGYRLANTIIKPYIYELSILSVTCFEGINSLSDLFLNYYFSTIQNKYFFNHINNILSLKKSSDIANYINNLESNNFISLSDMEALIKNG